MPRAHSGQVPRSRGDPRDSRSKGLVRRHGGGPADGVAILIALFVVLLVSTMTTAAGRGTPGRGTDGPANPSADMPGTGSDAGASPGVTAGPTWPQTVAPDAPDAPDAAPVDAGRRVVKAARWPFPKADTAFYRMVLLPDGFPGKKVRGRVLAHPIYGTYLIRAFLHAYELSHDVRDRDALLTVARAAVRRMEPYRGGLVFWYKPGRTVTAPHTTNRAYSALTQAYYMDLLSQVGVTLGAQDLLAAAEGAFRSLLVPATLGGVMRPGRLGPVLEEMPQAVPTAILNGWLSALVSLKQYAARTGSQEAAALLASSAREVARRLRRYDLRPLLGTAYSGFGRIAIRFDVSLGTSLTRASVTVDGRRIPLRLGVSGRGSDVVQIVKCGARRARRIIATCSGMIVLVPVTSAGITGTSTLRFALRGPAGAAAHGTLSRGYYDYVHERGRRVAGWTGLTTLPNGTRRRVVSISLTPGQIKATLRPTHFKHFGGHRRNTYHRIHVERLVELASDGGAAFSKYARRWRAYTCRWTTHAAYRLVPARDLKCLRARAVPRA